MRDKRKMAEKIMGGGGGGGTYNITYVTAANYSRIPNLLQNKSSNLTLYFNNMICKLSNLHIHEY